MRKILRDNSLSLVMFSLFGLCLLGHSLAGYAAYCDDQQAHQQPSLRYTAYVMSSHFWASVFENWESEFLQMAAYVLATVFCFQRGSAESKDPDAHEEVDEDPRQHQHERQAPGPPRNQKTRTPMRRWTRPHASITRSRSPPGRCGRAGLRSPSMPILSPQ